MKSFCLVSPYSSLSLTFQKAVFNLKGTCYFSLIFLTGLSPFAYLTLLFFFLISSWKSIIDHLLTHEKTMFKDLMSKFFCVNLHISHTLKDRCLLVIMSFYHVFQNVAQTFYGAVSATNCTVMHRICRDSVNEPF